MKTGEARKIIERLYGAHYNIQLERDALERDVVNYDSCGGEPERKLARELTDVLVKLELALQVYGTSRSESGDQKLVHERM